METSRQPTLDLGEYRAVECLDPESSGVNRWLAVGPDGAPSIVMAPDRTWADDPGYRLRFWSEANNSRRLTGRGTAPVRQVSSARAGVPWVAYDCFPALPLTAALAAHGGPLPAPVVWNLGVLLAEAVLRAHTQGLVHAGISPQSVLVTHQGALLTGYGLMRAAAVEGTERPVVPGVDEPSLPPEQRPGSTRPQPPGDIYALASVLLLAAAGHSQSSLSAEPGGVLARCHATDPAQRPPAEELLQALRGAAPGNGGELPPRVVAALDAQASRLPAPPTSVPFPAQAQVGERVVRRAGDQGTTATAAAVSSPSSSGSRFSSSTPSRRTLLVTAASATAGLAVGTGGVAAWRRFAPESRERVPRPPRGVAPAPLWRFPLPERDPTGQLPLLRGRTLIISHKKGILGVDVHRGKKLWSRDDVLPSRLLDAGGGNIVVAGGQDGEFLLLSARSGRIKWREKKYSAVESSNQMTLLLAGADGVVWFLTEDYGADDGTKMAVVAYSLRKRNKLWHAPLPPDYVETVTQPAEGTAGPALLRSELLIANTGFGAAEQYFTYIALDRESGRRKWKREYQDLGIETSDLVLPRGDNTLIAGIVNGLRSMSLSSGKERWTVPVEGGVDDSSAMRNGVLYATDRKLTSYAVDVRTGKVRWKRPHENPEVEGRALGGMTLTASGRTLLRTGPAELDALDPQDGSLRWRLATAGTRELSGRPGNAVVSAEGVAIIDNHDSIYALPVD
ncbi:outer membrane protein assembly factor BamB family protein [Streptomyces spirodelae]|uniref:PQQ-binding-like beta-propeller repeat protein n=1 Tax=Streptomyces spirodelae TaxID=2812904 RepID=A0ABS3WVJ9_9ACTN|nr:PQQ-binding-like beta-propeller repeat protein [Streptomyces spirodelae]MBO8187170.1 PQQ-binding-like beta-propeller repeat protein [Streptomyces spirodelae]